MRARVARSRAAGIPGRVGILGAALLALPPVALPAALAAQEGPPARPAFAADLWFLPDDGMLGFVEVAAGPFLLGSDRTRDPRALDNELWVAGASRTVELPAYRIGRYEVTVAQYAEFVRATGYAAAPESLQAPPDFPVAFVSWTDALAYARWLERTLRDAPRTPEPIQALLRDGWRITLPSEEEWEKAARGPDGRIYSWGDTPRADRARFASPGPTAVGSYPCPECPYGLSDMAGNVWEWTRTPFAVAPYAPGGVRVDLREDALWTMRGGSYADPENMVRAAVRGGADPGARRPFLGFRLALVAPDELARIR